MSIEAALRAEWHSHFKSNIDYRALDAELQQDHPTFRNLRVNLHDYAFDCDQRLSTWQQRDPVRQRAIVTLCCYLGIEAVIEMRINNICETRQPKSAANAVERSDFARNYPAIAARVAQLLRDGMTRATDVASQ